MRYFPKFFFNFLSKRIRDTAVITLLMYLFVSIILVSLLVTQSNKYTLIKNQYKSESQRNLIIIHNTLNLIFEYTSYINSNIGRQIAINNPNDYQSIFTLLSNPEYKHYNKTLYFSWSLFDWVDNKNFQRVNSQLGIRNPAPDMSIREYTTLSPQNPWTLQFAKPTIGNPSKKFVIPAGTGITNQNGIFIGTVVVGFGVEELINQIMQFVNNKDVGFILEGLDGTQYLKHGENIEYLAEQELEYYPFRLKVGFRNGIAKYDFVQQFKSDVLKILLGITSIGMLVFAIQRTLKKKTIQNDERAESLRYNYLFSNAQLNLMQKQILDLIDEINTDAIEKERGREVSDDEKRRTYSIIAVLQEAKRRLFNPSYLHITSVNFRDVMDAVLKMYAYEISLTKLKIQTEFHFKESVRIDEIKIKKVIGYIILYILDLIYEGKSELKISFTKDENSIKISFICNDPLYLIESHPEYSFISEIIKSHEGMIEIKDQNSILITISNSL